MKRKILIVIVTHNSERHIQWAVDGLLSSTLNIDLCIVDSGSPDTSYLDRLNVPSNVSLSLIKERNVGFVKGNNLAIKNLELYEYVLYLNPDAKIEADDLEKLLHIADLPCNIKFGAFTVPLIRFDIIKKCSLNVYDSVGIECSPSGRWYDVKSNVPVKEISNNDTITETNAICGAFFLVRSSILSEAVDSQGCPGFESSFYMYKEDIELSCRIISQGYKLGIVHAITAFHCRGWQGKRANIPYWAKYHSAKNDVYVAWRYKKRALPLSISKYFFVRIFER
ncbi:glycosyltransferase family 2 protein [Klebsiella pneumoniae]|uniref:glycosyltransferase family 2 protein n=1 Tax=Klebsiella pneumoniae TaxID=573 RepID=UPI000BB30125|nr:glycosyltransferase [Klebsiella pneumoniae]PAX10299.1 glycosyl transferase family 2 [Klebsiella pneumoniae]PIK02962.1 glycosyltransferase family 2 protein [Klebsiella pneumoniae]ULJ01441.1 glycosyltransferase family 2 protein [Klebsiella pneumoniae]